MQSGEGEANNENKKRVSQIFDNPEYLWHSRQPRLAV
jgi:hypothetical protein